MAFGLSEALDCLVEFLVLLPRALLLELRHSILLLQESPFDLHHLVVGFQHLRQEVIGAGDGHSGLNQDTHPVLYVLARYIVESDLSFNVVVDLQRANAKLPSRA